MKGAESDWEHPQCFRWKCGQIQLRSYRLGDSARRIQNGGRDDQDSRQKRTAAQRSALVLVCCGQGVDPADCGQLVLVAADRNVGTGEHISQANRLCWKRSANGPREVKLMTTGKSKRRAEPTDKDRYGSTEPRLVGRNENGQYDKRDRPLVRKPSKSKPRK